MRADVLADRYDVVIIGGGLAGLCAGVYTSRAGLSVLVCEQAEAPGGYFRSFARDGFHFDIGLKAVENAGMLVPMLRQLRLEDRVRLHRSQCSLVLPGRSVPLRKPGDICSFYDELAGRFPHERRGLDALLKDADRISAWVNLLVTIPNPMFEPYNSVVKRLPSWLMKNWQALIRAWDTRKLIDVPMTHFLKRYVSDPALVRVLTEFYFSGTPALFGMGYSRVYLDYYYPEGGLQRLTDALGDYIVSHGGVIRTGCRVDRIDVTQGRVNGIILSDGSRIGGQFVIAACDMRQVFLRMIEPASLDAAWRTRVEEAEVGESAINVFIGADLPPSEVASDTGPHVFLFPDYVGIDDRDRTEDDFYTRSPVEISIPCLNDPSLAPPGKIGIIISALASTDFNKEWGTDHGKQTPKYEALKERIADQLIATAERVFPDLKRRIIFRQVATPFTLERYTMNSGGSICGWTYDRRTTFRRKGDEGMRHSIATPVVNLIQAGHWTIYPGGAPVCIVSGRLAADHIVRSMKRRGSGQRKPKIHSG